MADTFAGAKLYICSTPQPNNLSQAEYEALTWIPIGKVGSMDTIGSDTNVLTYDTWDSDVIDKGKGMTNAGDPTVECARVPTDAGQVAVRAAALTKFKYAFKKESADAPQAGYSNTMIYNRGLVLGPTRPQGRNEDFDLEVYKLAFVQREIVVNPAVIP